jgi:hypothetical protein
MPATRNRAAKVHASIVYLCDPRELRFLYDLMQGDSRVPGGHPLPELYALLLALENMWGSECAKQLTVPPELMYDLVAYAIYAHHISEDAEEWRSGAAHDVHHRLQGFMESVAQAIRDGSIVKQKDDGVYIDLFRIPQWLYDEVVKEQQAFEPSGAGAGTHIAS